MELYVQMVKLKGERSLSLELSGCLFKRDHLQREWERKDFYELFLKVLLHDADKRESQSEAQRQSQRVFKRAWWEIPFRTPDNNCLAQFSWAVVLQSKQSEGSVLTSQHEKEAFKGSCNLILSTDLPKINNYSKKFQKIHQNLHISRTKLWKLPTKALQHVDYFRNTVAS